MACQKAHHQLKFHVSLVEGEDPLIASNLVVILEVLKGESLLVPLEVTKHLATCSRPLASFSVCRYAVTQHKRCHNRFLSMYACWSCSPRSFFSFPVGLFHLPPWGQSACVRVGFLVPTAVRKNEIHFSSVSVLAGLCLTCPMTCSSLYIPHLVSHQHHHIPRIETNPTSR
jgi:hypothetical protein